MTARRIARIALIVVVVIVALAIAAIAVLRSNWGGRQLARLVEGQLERALDADVSMGRISGDLLSSATIHELTISRDGEPLVAAEQVQVNYDLAGLAGGDIAIDEVTLIRPVIRLEEGPDGITLFTLFGADDTRTQPEPRAFAINPIRVVEGRVLIGPKVRDRDGLELPHELRDVQAQLAVAGDADGTAIRVEQLSFVGVEPRLVLESLSGGIRFHEGDLVLDQVAVRTAESELTLDGSLRQLGSGGGTQ